MRVKQHTGLCILILMILIGSDLSSFADTAGCIQLVKERTQLASERPWDNIRDYFASLTTLNYTQSRLLQLQAAIIYFEIENAKLIEILEAHVKSPSSGLVALNGLQLKDIPDIVSKLNLIASQLTSFAAGRDPIIVTAAFKSLEINVDAKLSDLCKLSQSVNLAGTEERQILDKLKNEAKAISAAEEALGKYIRQRYNL